MATLGKVVIVVAVIFGVFGLSQVKQPTTTDINATEARQIISDGCIEEGGAVLTAYCGCAADYMVANYKTEQLVEWGNKNDIPDKVLTAVGVQCNDTFST